MVLEIEPSLFSFGAQDDAGADSNLELGYQQVEPLKTLS